MCRVVRVHVVTDRNVHPISKFLSGCPKKNDRLLASGLRNDERLRV
jgi:hypothetical protein